jgi:peptidoglycan hydrolase-like protein with peptidoglycan-binding domain
MKKVLVLLASSLIFMLPAISFAAFTQDLSVGSTGQDVTDLQKTLISKGFSIPSISSGASSYGYFGSQTKAAVIAYQKANGISPASGYVGPITRTAINAAVATASNNSGASVPATPASPQASSSATQSASTASVLPPPMATEIAAVEQFCSIVEAQEGSQAAQNCSSSTFWNGYNSNAIFRSNIDSIVQQTLQKLSQQQAGSGVAQQLQAYCATHPVAYDPSMTPAANLLAEKEACGTATTADFTNYQLQQLQNSVNANTAAIQQQNTSPQNPTQPTTQTKCTTQPWWDAGVLRYSTQCSQTSY